MFLELGTQNSRISSWSEIFAASLMCLKYCCPLESYICKMYYCLGKRAAQVFSVKSISQNWIDYFKRWFEVLVFFFRSVYDGQEHGLFMEKLDVRIRNHDREIEKMCNHHFQGFVDSITELLKVRGEAQKLKVRREEQDYVAEARTTGLTETLSKVT